MGFKEQLSEDLKCVFFNAEEFAEPHTINGKEVTIVIDNDTLTDLYISKDSHTEELFTNKTLLYVLKKDLDFEPVPDLYIDFDGKGYIITDVKTDDESYSIVLKANES